MKLFDELVGNKVEGAETIEQLELCNNLLLHIQTNTERGIQTKNNNLELADKVNSSQVEVKRAKKILELNSFIDIKKEDERESFISLTTKGTIFVAKLKTNHLKEAMAPTSGDPDSETFVNYEMDFNFVEVYNQLSYRERVVFEAIVAATFCRDSFKSCYFRTLSSLLDAQADDIMAVLASLADTGLIVLVGEKSTKVYLANSREFLLTHYEAFYNTGYVKNDYIYKAGFHYDEYSDQSAPYEFPDFETVSTDIFDTEEIDSTGEAIEIEESVEINASAPMLSVAPSTAEHARVFIIDTASISLEHFVQTTAMNSLTNQDYYVAMLSPSAMGGSMSFSLFNHLMKLPCRGETDMVEDLNLYYQFFTIKIVEVVQQYPNSDIVVLTNDMNYPAISKQLQAKLNLRPTQIQVMSHMA